MTDAQRAIPGRRTQALVFLAMTCVATAASEVGARSGARPFERFLGRFDPSLTIFVAAALGAIALARLASAGFVVVRRDSLRGARGAFALALVFGAVAILVDCLAPFPKDMNVSFPDSLAFYPAIGFLVEIVFHLVPLGIAVVALGPVEGRWGRRTTNGLAIGIVAALEATFQSLLGSGDAHATWVPIWIWWHVFGINLVQLITFRRNGFAAMILVRLVYYLVWHIVWGLVRTTLLF